MTVGIREILNVLLKFPWWGNAILAAVIYAALFWVVPAVIEGQSLFNPLTSFIQSMAPVAAFVTLIAAAVSAFFRLRKSKLLERQISLDSVGRLSWRQFLSLVSEAFRRKGFMVLDKTEERPDGGVDIWLRKNGEVSFVQCKNWKARSVGVKAVGELYSVMMAESVKHGIMVTYGGFDLQARKFAKANSIALIDGPQLRQMMASVQPSGSIRDQKEAARTCPRCGSEMVPRVARKGPDAGKKFWGCSKFPDCRGLVAAGD